MKKQVLLPDKGELAGQAPPAAKHAEGSRKPKKTSPSILLLATCWVLEADTLTDLRKCPLRVNMKPVARPLKPVSLFISFISAYCLGFLRNLREIVGYQPGGRWSTLKKVSTILVMKGSVNTEKRIQPIDKESFDPQGVSFSQVNSGGPGRLPGSVSPAMTLTAAHQMSSVVPRPRIACSGVPLPGALCRPRAKTQKCDGKPSTFWPNRGGERTSW